GDVPELSGHARTDHEGIREQNTGIERGDRAFDLQELGPYALPEPCAAEGPRPHGVFVGPSSIGPVVGDVRGVRLEADAQRLGQGFQTIRPERSEEHTSGHVSISYAVFCLKKKTICLKLTL